MKQGFVMAVAMGWAVAGMAQEGTKLEYGSSQTYTQTLVVEAGGDVSVPTIAPVYDGHSWALSTRWDDSNPNALNIRRKMLENGIRGSFYLNSRTPEKPAGSLAQKLTGADECSVGGHSSTHPHLEQLPANTAFRELMANRIALECLTDRPVNSLAFPFGGYQSKDNPEALHGITEAVLRTGYSHCVYSGFVTRNRFLPAGVISTGWQVVPGDRKIEAEKFWASIERVRANEADSRKMSDCIFLGVHPWQQGEELERLGEVMAKLRDWDDFWHCTQTEWAAYAKQRRGTTVTAAAPGSYTLVRPAAYDLGNAIPLTLVFASADVRSAKVDGVDCPIRHADGKTYVNVPQAAQAGVPAKIDETDLEGCCGEFPGLNAKLAFDPATRMLTFTLANTGGALSDGLLTVSLPPACDPGMLRWQRPALANGETWTATTAAPLIREGEYWQGGTPYFAAQLDFVRDGQRGRLFATCTGPAPAPAQPAN